MYIYFIYITYIHSSSPCGCSWPPRMRTAYSGSSCWALVVFGLVCSRWVWVLFFSFFTVHLDGWPTTRYTQSPDSASCLCLASSLSFFSCWRWDGVRSCAMLMLLTLDSLSFLRFSMKFSFSPPNLKLTSSGLSSQVLVSPVHLEIFFSPFCPSDYFHDFLDGFDVLCVALSVLG